MVTGQCSQPIVEVLDQELIIHTVVWTRYDILLVALPHFRNWLISCLLKGWDSSLKGVGFARREELDEEHIWTLFPSVHSASVGVEPLFRSPKKREQKQLESDGILSDSPLW